MTLADLFTLLNSTATFENKVAYRAFPVGNAPDLPYICILATNTDNFNADNKVYKVIQGVDVELYTENKEPDTEAALEAVLDGADIPWDKFEEFLDSENCYQITYEISI